MRTAICHSIIYQHPVIDIVNKAWDKQMKSKVLKNEWQMNVGTELDGTNFFYSIQYSLCDNVGITWARAGANYELFDHPFAPRIGRIRENKRLKALYQIAHSSDHQRSCSSQLSVSHTWRRRPSSGRYKGYAPVQRDSMITSFAKLLVLYVPALRHFA